MTKEEYYKITDKALEIDHLICSLAERCFVAENARLKVGDLTVIPDSTDTAKVIDRIFCKTEDDDEVLHPEILYTVERIGDKRRFRFTQSEMIDNE